MLVEQAVNNEVSKLPPQYQQLIEDARKYTDRSNLRINNNKLYNKIYSLGLLDLAFYYSISSISSISSKFAILKEYVQISRPDYYEKLIQNAHIIIEQSKVQTQAELGQDLGLNQSQMSTVLKMLKGYINVHANNS